MHPSDKDPNNPTGQRYAEDFCTEHNLDPDLWGHINNVALDAYNKGRDEIRPLIQLLIDNANSLNEYLEKNSIKHVDAPLDRESGLTDAARAIKSILTEHKTAKEAFDKYVNCINFSASYAQHEFTKKGIQPCPSCKINQSSKCNYGFYDREGDFDCEHPRYGDTKHPECRDCDGCPELICQECIKKGMDTNKKECEYLYFNDCSEEYDCSHDKYGNPDHKDYMEADCPSCPYHNKHND